MSGLVQAIVITPSLNYADLSLADNEGQLTVTFLDTNTSPPLESNLQKSTGLKRKKNENYRRHYSSSH